MPMYPRKPPLRHPPEVYRAIVQEHDGSVLLMAERLLASGWSLVDAAWAAVNWDPPTLAAAIAQERTKRGTRPTNLSDADLAKLRSEDRPTQEPPSHLPQPRKTTRVTRTTPRLPSQLPKRTDGPGT